VGGPIRLEQKKTERFSERVRILERERERERERINKTQKQQKIKHNEKKKKGEAPLSSSFFSSFPLCVTRERERENNTCISKKEERGKV